MRIDAWLKAASEDAEQRGLPELTPLLEALARSTAALRDAEQAVRASMTGAGATAEAPDRRDGVEDQ
jgi:hypothetical protein